MYHIALATDDNYAAHCATTMMSIVENTSEKIQFHILHSGLSSTIMHRIESSFIDKNCCINFINMSKYDFSEHFDLTIDYISMATYYRLLLPNLLPTVDICLYIDCDTIVLDDITKLMNVDISKNKDLVAAAIEDEQSISNSTRLHLKNYFNAGVLLLHLKRLRNRHYVTKFFEIAEKCKDDIIYQDQDILNIAFDKKVKFCDIKWNAMNTVFHTDIFADASYSVSSERKARYSPSILHFNGVEKPWHFCCCHPHRLAYIYYLMKTNFLLNCLKQALLILVSAVFKIDRTFKEFSIRLFSIKVFNLYGHTTKSLILFGFKIF